MEKQQTIWLSHAGFMPYCFQYIQCILYRKQEKDSKKQFCSCYLLLLPCLINFWFPFTSRGFLNILPCSMHQIALSNSLSLSLSKYPFSPSLPSSTKKFFTFLSLISFSFLGGKDHFLNKDYLSSLIILNAIYQTYLYASYCYSYNFAFVVEIS